MPRKSAEVDSSEEGTKILMANTVLLMGYGVAMASMDLNRKGTERETVC